MADLKTLTDELVVANRILSAEKVCDAFGHVSVRHPGDPSKFLLSRGRAPELIEQAALHRCAVLVDPKGRDFGRYRGADLLKPNAAEMQAVVGEWSGEDEFRARAMALRRELRIKHLLVTRGDAGMTLFGPDGVHHRPAEVREVYDVSGAGDTVLATLAHCLARGATMVEAMHWANKAAGVVVGKFGTASVTPQEIGLPEHFGGAGPEARPVRRRAARGGAALGDGARLQ